MTGVSAHRVREAMGELREKKNNSAAADGPAETTGKRAVGGGGGGKKGGGAKAEKPFKQKDPVGFMIYYFGIVFLALAVARLIKGPFPFEKRLYEALEEQAKGKSEARRIKEAAAIEMRASIPLVFAAGDGDIDEVRRLIASGHDVMERSKVGETPLHTAGISGNADVVAALLRAGADPNARTKGGQYLKMTPSHWMVYGGAAHTALISHILYTVLSDPLEAALEPARRPG